MCGPARPPVPGPAAAEPAPEAGSAPSRPLQQGAPRRLDRLRRRADFLRVAQGQRAPSGGLLLQARAREDDPAAPARVGFTCSRKLGNAVTRNRARRRLRALARALLAGGARPGWDYVLVGRPGETVARPFAALADDLARALARVHAAPGREPRG